MNLLEFARAHGAEMLPPISEARIIAFEAERGLRLPPGLREFYLEAGGTMEFTESIWRIWPFKELVTLDQILPKIPDIEYLNHEPICPKLSDYLAFIDALIEAPLYAVCANPKNSRYGEVISVSGDLKPFLEGPIASFEEFLVILSKHWEQAVLPYPIRE